MVEGDLRKEVSLNIKRLIEFGSYRGFAIAATCRSADSVPIRMRAPVKGRVRERSRPRRKRRKDLEISP